MICYCEVMFIPFTLQFLLPRNEYIRIIAGAILLEHAKLLVLDLSLLILDDLYICITLLFSCLKCIIIYLVIL